MKLEQQVCSPELAKRLKELGVKQKSLYYYYKHLGKGYSKPMVPLVRLRSTYHVSAFTVAELGELMKGKGMGTTAYSDMHSGWWITGGEWIVGKQQYSHTIHGEQSWADCLAKMLVYLLENNLITL